jgi:anti-sigma B factor antagonist
VITLVLDGSLDAMTAPALRQEIADWVARGRQHIVLNLSRVYFLDSTALGVLIGSLKRLRSAGGALTLGSTSRTVTQMLAVTGLDKIFGSTEA